MRELTETLQSAQEAMVLEPKITITFSDPLGLEDDIPVEQDRILQIPSQEETSDSQTAEIIFDNSDGFFTDLDLQGWDAVLELGLVTEAIAGVEYMTMPPLKVISQNLSSAPGILQCRISLAGIPNLLAEDKASKDYFHHWSDTKTVKDMITEIADGEPVETELTEEQAEVDGYINLDDTVVSWFDENGEEQSSVLHGVGQSLIISDRTITKLAFRLKRTSIPPDGTNIIYRIYDLENDEFLTPPAGLPFPIADIPISPAVDFCWVTLESPIYISAFTPSPDLPHNIWIFCEHTDGDGSNYISVSYNSVAIKPNENIVRIFAAGAPSRYWETSDEDCAYSYKYTGAGIDCWERGTSPVETYCEPYEVVYDPHGTHTGGTHATIMTDSEAAFKPDALIGRVIYNVTDGSSGTITDNDATTVTVVALASGADNQWQNGDSYTIVAWLLSSYQPKDAFRIYEGDNRLSVLNRLLYYTDCEKWVENDGKIHVFVPTISGEAYDSAYSLETGHTFFSKSVRKALVIPNRIVVHSLKGDESQYSGEATDDESYALLPLSDYRKAKLISHGQAASMAQAMISRLQVAAQRGSASVPMNLGSEVFDYVIVTDSREQGDYRIGNIGYLRRSYKPGVGWNMVFSFGRLPLKSVAGTRPSLLPEARAKPEPTADEAILRWGDIKDSLTTIADNFDYAWKTFDDLIDIINEIISKLGWFEGEQPTEQQILDALINYFTKTEIQDNYYTKNEVNEKIAEIELDATPSDVTASRAAATTYTNSTGKILMVTITMSMAADQVAYLRIDSTNDPPSAMQPLSWQGGPLDGFISPGSCLVPKGWKYRLTKEASCSISKWIETTIG